MESEKQSNESGVCCHCNLLIRRRSGIGGVQWIDGSESSLNAACAKSPSHAHEPRNRPGQEVR